jgi:hypothetical protein
VTTWDQLSNLPPLRDEHGTIVLEELDADTRTAAFRVYGRTSLTATLTPTGELAFDADPPQVLREALKGSDVPDSRGLTPSNPQPPSRGSDPHEGRRGLWVATGVAAGIAAIAVRRRR